MCVQTACIGELVVVDATSPYDGGIVLEVLPSTDNSRCLDMCIDMCIDMCMDMCIDMCRDMCIDMCIDMCMDMYVGMRMNMYKNMCIGMCVDMCLDVCIGMLAVDWVKLIATVAELSIYMHARMCCTHMHASVCVYARAPMHACVPLVCARVLASASVVKKS